MSLSARMRQDFEALKRSSLDQDEPECADFRRSGIARDAMDLLEVSARFLETVERNTTIDNAALTAAQRAFKAALQAVTEARRSMMRTPPR